MDTTPREPTELIDVEVIGSARKPPSSKRVIAAGMIGTIVEYFDFLIYATVSALVFGDLFFPNDDPFVESVFVWGTFAVSYLARPVGGIIFGHFGDKIGRTRVLFVTLIMMGVSTTAIGLLPTYDQIGMAAPIILILLRVVQGLGVGGEYGGAALMMIEHAEGTGKRGLWGSLTTASSSMGFLLASALMAVLTATTSDEQFSGWAWRIPFLLSAAMLLVGFYIRLKISETPVMRATIEAAKTVKAPIIDLVRNHRKALLIALGAPFGQFAAYYVTLVFAIPYVVSLGDVDQSFLLAMSSVSQVFYVAAVIFGGYLSDRIGRRKPMLFGAVCLSAWSFAFFPLLISGTVVGTLVALTVALLCVGLIVGPMAAFLAELFGTGVRYSGLSVGYQFSAAIAGGLSPVFATFLIHQYGTWHPVPIMVALALVVTFVAVYFSKERAHSELTS
jgi:MFS family permease